MFTHPSQPRAYAKVLIVTVFVENFPKIVGFLFFILHHLLHMKSNLIDEADDILPQYDDSRGAYKIEVDLNKAAHFWQNCQNIHYLNDPYQMIFLPVVLCKFHKFNGRRMISLMVKPGQTLTRTFS